MRILFKQEKALHTQLSKEVIQHQDEQQKQQETRNKLHHDKFALEPRKSMSKNNGNNNNN